mgnify:FL=1
MPVLLHHVRPQAYYALVRLHGMGAAPSKVPCKLPPISCNHPPTPATPHLSPSSRSLLQATHRHVRTASLLPPVPSLPCPIYHVTL